MEPGGEKVKKIAGDLNVRLALTTYVCGSGLSLPGYIRRERPSTPSAHMARAVRLSPRTALSFAPDGLSLSSSDVPGYSGLKRGAHRAGQSGRALISESRRLLKPGSENGSMPAPGVKVNSPKNTCPAFS